MPFERDRALTDAEDFLRRQLGSRAARESQKRKVQRGIREVLRRIRRSAFLFVGLLSALIAYSILVAPIGFFTWLVAFPALFLIAMVALFWPSRRSDRGFKPADEATRLESGAARMEEWLVERCHELPRQALPIVDTILVTLSELQPCLAALPKGAPVEGEARRLICQHLPRLVSSYLDLPPAERGPGSQSTARLTESLETVADELMRLSADISEDRRLGFDTQHRFIETRYRDGR